MSSLPASDFDFSASTAAEFERALSCAVTNDSDSMCLLEKAVAECARELEAAGFPPERMLVTMKAQFRSAARRHASKAEPEMRIEDTLLAKIVLWSIVAYFDSAAAQPA
ncbi:MAG: hypothetical protein ABI408_06075 [Gemmatimonadaceae bacterium]